MNPCLNCGRPVTDGWYLCHSDTNNCTALAFGHLDAIVREIPELETTIVRRDKLSDGTGRTTETPLPFNATAADAADQIHEALTAIARTIIGRRGLVPASDPLRAPLDGAIGRDQQAIAAARYIKVHLRWVRTQGFKVGGEAFAMVAYRTIEDAARLLIRTIDAHPALTDLGVCGNDGCTGRLLAAHGARYARCRDCGWIASVAETTGLLLDWARDQLFTATELASLLSKWHTRRRIPEGTIRSWATRGLLPRKGRDGRAWLYNLGDALDLADRLTPAPTNEQETLAA